MRVMCIHTGKWCHRPGSDLNLDKVKPQFGDECTVIRLIEISPMGIFYRFKEFNAWYLAKYFIPIDDVDKVGREIEEEALKLFHQLK